MPFLVPFFIILFNFLEKNFTWLHDSRSYFPCPPPIRPHRPSTALPTCISTGFYMCHQSGPISILLIVDLGGYVQSSSQIMSASSHVFSQLFFFCVSTPVDLPLHVDSVLSHRSLIVVLDHCIAANRGVHYI